LVNLVMVATSRDKTDDELSKQIRYSVFKTTLTFSVILIGISTLLLSVYDINSLPSLVILYYFEGMLVLHIILYHLGRYYAPRWLLSEEDTPPKFNRLAVTFMVMMLILIVLLIILYVIEPLEA